MIPYGRDEMLASAASVKAIDDLTERAYASLATQPRRTWPLAKANARKVSIENQKRKEPMALNHRPFQIR